jgi:hypothetical protein
LDIIACNHIPPGSFESYGIICLFGKINVIKHFLAAFAESTIMNLSASSKNLAFKYFFHKVCIRLINTSHI